MIMAAAALALGVTGVAANTAVAVETQAEAKISYPSRLKKCADLNCVVHINEGEGFRAHRFWITRVTFPQISRNNIQVKVFGDGFSSECGGSAPLHCTFNGVDFTIRDVHGSTAGEVRIHP
jgi:hypothetical protein